MEKNLLKYSKKPCEISLKLLFLFLGIISCQYPSERSETKKSLPCPIGISINKLYGQHANQNEALQIKQIIQLLVDSICLGNLDNLPSTIDPELGLFIEGKAHWTKSEVEKDLNNSKGYFQTYYFNDELLSKRKNSKESITIQKTIQNSGGIQLDFFFDSPNDCEVKLIFQKNKELSRTLINPAFQKFESKWFLVRML